MKRCTHTCGTSSSDVYTTAWAALVPDLNYPDRPAWPQTLAYIRTHQHVDGCWGNDLIFHAHDRVISTLAALRALLVWDDRQDADHIRRGVEALHKLLPLLEDEPYETIGFEILFPRLFYEVSLLRPDISADGLYHLLNSSTEKLALLGVLQPTPGQPRSWWFSMEAMSEWQLAEVEDWVLNEYGAIAVSPSATASYLRSRRLAGYDSPLAAAYLDGLVNQNGGGLAHLWPLDSFEVAWTVDAYRRAGLPPSHPLVAHLIELLERYWQRSPAEGLGYSSAFSLIDGDDTAVAYTVLRWAGLEPDDTPLLHFWDGQRYHTYLDERKASISAHVHALAAFRQDHTNSLHQSIAHQITDWLRERIGQEGLPLHDKWHISPFYPTARLVEPLLGWDDALAGACIDSLLLEQQADGGWGWHGPSTLEETSLVILGLRAAWQQGLVEHDVIKRAAHFLEHRQVSDHSPGLWVGKVLYRPHGVVANQLEAARQALATPDKLRW